VGRDDFHVVRFFLCEQFLDELARDIGQPKIAPLKTIREFRVIEAEQMEQRSMQIVNMDLVTNNVKTELV
jgi:hypothetical protein